MASPPLRDYPPNWRSLEVVTREEASAILPGALRHGQDLRVDTRNDAKPNIVADARSLPLRKAAVSAVLIDPPYSVEYARDLYVVDYPRPSHSLREAARVLSPGGRVGIVHFLVPMTVEGLALARIWSITTGAGYRIRAVTVFQRDQASLL